MSCALRAVDQCSLCFETSARVPSPWYIWFREFSTLFSRLNFTRSQAKLRLSWSYCWSNHSHCQGLLIHLRCQRSHHLCLLLSRNLLMDFSWCIASHYLTIMPTAAFECLSNFVRGPCLYLCLCVCRITSISLSYVLVQLYLMSLM